MTYDDPASSASFDTIEAAALARIVGGAFDFSQLNFGQIGQQIGGLIDMFSGGSGNAGAIGGQIGSFIQQLMGMFGGGAQQQAGAAQQQGGAPQQQQMPMQQGAEGA